MDNCAVLASVRASVQHNRIYLHSTAQTEHAVIGFLGPKSLQGGLDNVVLLGEQIIGPVRQLALAHPDTQHGVCHGVLVCACSRLGPLQSCVPQSELPVAGGVAVPVGERLHPALEPRALGDVGGERRGRHVAGVEGVGCRQLQMGVSSVRW